MLDTVLDVAETPDDILAATPQIAEAVQTPTIIDAEEFDRESLDDYWREFCLDADRYVAASTRPPVGCARHGSL